jgi:membrane-associated protein
MISVIGLLLYYKYIFAFLFAVIEGPMVMVLAGFLVKLNYLSFWPVYFLLMAGDLIADTAWYAIGYYGARPIVLKYGKFFGITKDSLKRTERIFKKHQNKILFLSKITMGFGFALVVLVTAGISRISFKKYITFNFLGQFIWTGFLMGIGYLFGGVYVTLNRDLQLASIISFIVLILFGFYGLSKYLRRKNIENKTK